MKNVKVFKSKLVDDTIIARIGDASVFSKIDLSQAFRQ